MLGVKMNKNKESSSCWEFWDCSEKVRTKCAAYIYNSGRECWFIASSAEPRCPRIKRDFEYCWQCPWFKKLNPDFDEKNK